MSQPEPWLRGPIPDVPLHVLPAFFSFQQMMEDLAHHASAINPDQLWRAIAGNHSLGYHLKHISGSIDRLTTYLTSQPLSDAQLTFLDNEHQADCGLEHLLTQLHIQLFTAQQQLLQIKPESLFEPRFVGRQQLPTTVFGLIVHLCEHTQRHLGQAILICKLLRE